MIFGKLLNTKIEEVNNLDTGDLLAIVRAFEDGQGKNFVNKDIFSVIVNELSNRGIVCIW